MKTAVILSKEFDWSKVSDEIFFFAEGIPALSKSSFLRGTPDVENQISASEQPWAITFFQQFHLPIIRDAGIEPNDCRILEIGSGFGWLAYGTLNTINPEVYVATDIFPQLVTVLSDNLRKWTKSDTAAALFDPQDPFLFRSLYFNVIQSHSVLHHVLDYRTAVRALYNHLASPGVIVFCEPCLEGYLFFLISVRMFSRVQTLPQKLTKEIEFVETYILQRTGSLREDVHFLRQLGSGDKYLFSAYDLFELADNIGAKLYIKKDGRSLKENLKFELKLRGADENIIAKYDDFLSFLLPEGVENAYFSDLRQVFSFHKS
ncbi:MAG: class I SAM-dependent methyltransferase [Smithella sp.]|jgi:SAM-dependent methyltransferase